MFGDKIRISVIVPTRNEEKNISCCLESLRDFDEVFVVDSQSSDKTTTIAKSFGAKVVQFYYDGRWPKKKNWAISNLRFRNDWIFIMDADERLTPELREEMAEAISANGISGYYVRWKFIFLGKWMKHCWNDGWMIRLFRKNDGEYENLGMTSEGGWDNEVHEHVVVNGNVGRLKSYLLHDSNNSMEFWIQKQNEFSTWNAERRKMIREEKSGRALMGFSGLMDFRERRRMAKLIFLHLPLKPIFMFVYLYIIRLGFLDGVAGLYFCALRASHELNICAKTYESRVMSRKQ